MFSVQAARRKTGESLSRRRFLEVGALGGLTLLNAPRSFGSESASADPTFGRAKRCLLLFLMGGPPQIDTFDPKPLAPANVRGELSPIATRIPGVQFSELFPKLAVQAHRL